MTRLIFCLFFALSAAHFSTYVVAQDYKDRPEWIALKAELVRDNAYDETTLDAIMARVKRQDRASM